MPPTEFQQMLLDTTTEVLESMFFTNVGGDVGAGPLPAGPWIASRLSFQGSPSGRFGVSLPFDTARRMTSDFLGLENEAQSETRTGEVVCELANMLCGSLLSRWERDSRFELGPPELDLPGAAIPESAAVRRSFALEDGVLSVWLEWEPAK